MIQVACWVAGHAGQEEDGMGEQEEMQGYADDDGRQGRLAWLHTGRQAHTWQTMAQMEHPPAGNVFAYTSNSALCVLGVQPAVVEFGQEKRSSPQYGFDQLTRPKDRHTYTDMYMCMGVSACECKAASDSGLSA